MPLLKRIVLDVLKPHHPNALEFANAIATANPGCEITVTVTEMDEKTETTVILIESDNNIQFDEVVNTINSLGASVHSIDEVKVSSVADLKALSNS